MFELVIEICNGKGGEYIIGGDNEYLSSLLIDMITQFATIILPWVDNADYNFALRSHLPERTLFVAALILQLRTLISRVCPALLIHIS